MTAAQIGALILLGSAASCGPNDECAYHHNHYLSQFSYKVTATMTSPSGIRIDPTGQAIAMEKLERQTNEVEQCLKDAFGDPPKMPPDVVRDGQCSSNTFDLPLHRECLTVKVPDDWVLSCDKSQMLLPAPAPDEGCLAKGLHPTPECPCRWRGGIQDDRYIVTTPAFYIYKDPLIRMVTGCNNPWYSPPLAKCAQPSVPPLP